MQGLKKEKLRLCSWKYVLRNEERYLKLSAQVRFLEIFHSQEVTVDLSQTRINKTQTIRVFWAIKEKSFIEAVRITVSRKVGRPMPKTSISKDIFGNVLLLNCDYSNN